MRRRGLGLRAGMLSVLVVLPAMVLSAFASPVTAIDPTRPMPERCLVRGAGGVCHAYTCESQGDLIYPLPCCRGDDEWVVLASRPGGGSNQIVTYLCIHRPDGVPP